MTMIYRLRRGRTLPEEQRYGIEVEVEGYRGCHPEVMERWNLVDDGSLRDGGVEFVSPPINLETAKRSIEMLYHDLKEQEWVTNQRTGIHVHMDMLGRTVEELRRILVAYICCEPALFDYCGADREENIYCVPFYRADGDMRIIRKFLDKPTGYTLRDLQHTCKYSGLYTEPLYRFGTIEFRGAPTWRKADEFMVLLRSLDTLIHTSCGYASEGEILDKFDDAPLEALTEFMPAIALPKHEQLLLDTNCLSVAESLVRTKLTHDDWQFSIIPQPQPVDGARARAGRRIYPLTVRAGNQPGWIRRIVPEIAADQGDLVDVADY